MSVTIFRPDRYRRTSIGLSKEFDGECYPLPYQSCFAGRGADARSSTPRSRVRARYAG